MPGVCSNGNAYLQTFLEAARRQGGVVAIEGDQPCGVNGFRTFSWDAGRRTRARGGRARRRRVDGDPTRGNHARGLLTRAQRSRSKWCSAGRAGMRIVLIGAPTDPSPKNLGRARAVVTMPSCDRDVPARMKQAAQATSRAGVPATYLQMPGCTSRQRHRGRANLRRGLRLASHERARSGSASRSRTHRRRRPLNCRLRSEARRRRSRGVGGVPDLDCRWTWSA